MKETKEIAIEMIARLRQEKKMLLEAVLAIEDWAQGEGVFITPTLKAKLETARRAADHKGDNIALCDIRLQRNASSPRGPMKLSDEERERRRKRAKAMADAKWGNKSAEVTIQD